MNNNHRAVPLRLLLVEKSQNEADVLLNMLLYAGYQVASKRISGLAELETVLPLDRWDLVLCDCALLEESAVRMVQVIRSFSSLLPIIAVFDDKNRPLFADLFRCGANDCVPKSNMARLVIAVERERMRQILTSENKVPYSIHRETHHTRPSLGRQLKIRCPVRRKKNS